MKTLTIGNVELANRYILAPMAGVTDLPFRLAWSAHRSEPCACRYFQIAHQDEDIMHILLFGSPDDKPVCHDFDVFGRCFIHFLLLLWLRHKSMARMYHLLIQVDRKLHLKTTLLLFAFADNMFSIFFCKFFN